MKAKIIPILILIMLIDFCIFSAYGYASKKIDLLPWDQVNEILPRYSKFTVVDFETGKEFHVQRRAGSHHADVQPLTKKDTKIMKTIYNGKWSWRRRSIIVKKGNKRIAASMHGMPHGAGALVNNFPGHFCIHFYGSTTHRTNNMDLSHKLMILKAAGTLENYLAAADPYEVIKAYISGIKEKDNKIVSMISLQHLRWKKVFGEIEAVQINQMTLLPTEDFICELYLSIPVKIEWFFKDVGRKKSYVNIELIRTTPFDTWKVDSISFLRDNELLNLKRKSLGD